MAMTVRQWLSRYRELVEEIDRETRQAHYWEDKAVSLSSSKLSFAPKTRRLVSMQDYVAEFLDLASHCAELGREAQAAKEEIEKVVDSLEEPSYRRVLRLKYIDGMTYQQIADHLHYSKRQIHRIHGRALKRVTQCHPHLSYNVSCK